MVTTNDNRLHHNEARLIDIVAVAKRTMTALLASADEKLLAKPDSVDSYKKYDEYINTIITNHLRNKFNLM